MRSNKVLRFASRKNNLIAVDTKNAVCMKLVIRDRSEIEEEPEIYFCPKQLNCKQRIVDRRHWMRILYKQEA
jgi:hypothetical protein